MTVINGDQLLAESGGVHGSQWNETHLALIETSYQGEFLQHLWMLLQ